MGPRLSGALAALYFMTVLSAFLGVVLPNLISQEPLKTCWIVWGSLVVHPTNRKWDKWGQCPLITRVVTHLLSGMNHQEGPKKNTGLWLDPLKCRKNETEPKKLELFGPIFCECQKGWRHCDVDHPRPAGTGDSVRDSPLHLLRLAVWCTWEHGEKTTKTKNSKRSGGAGPTEAPLC